MMNDFRSEVSRAKNIKQLDKILKQVVQEFGFLSPQHGEILNLCWEKLETL